MKVLSIEGDGWLWELSNDRSYARNGLNFDVTSTLSHASSTQGQKFIQHLPRHILMSPKIHNSLVLDYKGLNLNGSINHVHFLFMKSYNNFRY